MEIDVDAMDSGYTSSVWTGDATPLPIDHNVCAIFRAYMSCSSHTEAEIRGGYSEESGGYVEVSASFSWDPPPPASAPEEEASSPGS